MPEACEAQLRVFDVNGRELLRMEGVAISGVLTCELVTPFGTSAKRMILMTN